MLTTASWHWRKLVRVKDALLPATVNDVWTPSGDGKYSTQSGYMWLMEDVQRFAGTKVVWNKFNVPKHGFITWLVCHKKLLTRDRLKAWNMEVADARCLLCGAVDESIKHLFFRCLYSQQVCR